MARYGGIPVLLLAALLNATVLAELRLANGGPDLVFLLVIAWALLVDLPDALIWAVIGGTMQDLFSVAPLGTSAVGLVLTVFVADTLFGRVARRNVILPPLAAVGGTLLYHLSTLVILRLTGSSSLAFDRALIYVTLPALIAHALLILPVFRAVGQVQHWLTPRRVRLE